MLDKLWLHFLHLAERAVKDERGDGLVNWIVLALGLAAAAAALVALLRPAIENAGQQIVNFISGG